MKRARRTAAVLAAIAIAAGVSAARAEQNARAPAAEVGPADFQPTTPPAIAPRRSDLASAAPRLPAEARHDLGELTAAERVRLSSPDARPGTGARPKKAAVKVGISRALPAEVGFRALASDLPVSGSRMVGGGLLERRTDGGLVWTAAFSSAGAGALRLHVAAARLPAGSRVYVYGENGEIHGSYDFTSGIRPEGFWTNTVFADRIFLEVQVPPGIAAADLARAFLVMGGVVHIDHPGFAPSPKASPTARPKSDACFVDRSCVSVTDFPNIDRASRAVAQLNFNDGGTEYICSGGLLNTAAGSNIPYLLTANHCFSNQPAATSLEAFWQYRTATCNGVTPDESLFPRTLGSTLLATADAATSSDYTFVQLSQNPPADSVMLGWTTADFFGSAGLVLYRLSYPISESGFDVRPQIYTREQVLAPPSSDCSEAPSSRFYYETDIQGGTGGGSSGSPAFLEDLRVVGQEYGSCGSNTNDNCDTVNNDTLDGAFSLTFPALQQWLQPGAPGACVVNATTLCLDGARFRVTVFYATDQGQSGAAAGVSLSGDSGYFWFFSPDNIELVVKVLTGCGINNRFWVFSGGLTNVGVTLLVEDTVRGTSQVYSNPVGTPFQPLQDTQAFHCP